MSTELDSNISADSKAMLLQVLEVNQYSPESIMALWGHEVTLQDAKGILAIVQFTSEQYVVAINLPVIVMPVYGKIFGLGEALQLLTVVSEIPSAQFALKDNVLFLTLCLRLTSFKQEEIPTIFDRLLKAADEVRTDLLAAIRIFYQLKTPDEWTYPEPILPNIKMTPKEMQVIYSILSRCNHQVQETYTYLMEKWSKAGYLIATTPSSIVLDIPYGDRTARLAMLYPGVSVALAAMEPQGIASSPIIILSWESLRNYQGLPSESVDLYEKMVKKITALHLTESSAHIEMDNQFDMKTAQALLKAMKTLVKSVRPELIEESTTSVPVTPDNIQLTLAACSQHVQAVYLELVDAWKAAGGTVQSPRPGRIYLKMKTKAHRSGRLAQYPRNFNLAVLAGPRGRKPANIQIEWNLSQSEFGSYLDCIPDAVARFEEIVTSLPGFEIKGTITYLWMNEKFQLSHAQLLSKAMISLKNTEQTAL